MADNIAKLKETALVFEPARALETAISQGASVEVIGRIMDFQERWEQTQARKAFNSAIAAFKANPPEILKTVQVGFDSRRTGEKVGYKHEDLAELLAAVDPALAAHGLWARFKVKSEPTLVTVTCVIGHADGYSEADNTLSAAPDTSGNKNAVQAIGSAVSYLQRYTLKAALGLAAARDDDGKRSGAQVLSPEQVDEINDDLLNGDIDVEKFLEKVNAPSVSDIPQIKFISAKRWIQRAVAENKYRKKGKK